MNKLEIRVRRLEDDAHGKIDEVRFVVDERDLSERVRDVERRHTNDRRVQRYLGPPSRVALGPSRYLLGEPSGDGYWDVVSDPEVREVAIGGCGCGLPGCWPLLMTVELHDDRVVWRDFYNYQVRDEGSDWGWREIGPFVFDRATYEAVLGLAADAHES